MSPNPAPASWKRLGELLIRRRVELDPRYQNRSTFCAERGLDYRLAYDIEEARRTNFRSTTLAGVAAAYAVTPDSLSGVLHDPRAGLEPTPAPSRPAPLRAAGPDAPSSSTPVPADSAAPVVPPAWTDQVWGEVGRAKGVYGPQPSGREVFPADMHEAGIWEYAWLEEERVHLIAWIRMRNSQPRPADSNGNGTGRRAS